MIWTHAAKRVNGFSPLSAVVTTIDTIAELNQLDPRYKRLLAPELDTLGILDRICPVLFEDGRAGVFVVRGNAYDDQVMAVLELLKRRRFRLQSNPVYSVARPVLLGLIKPLQLNDERAVVTALQAADSRPALIKIFDEIVFWALETGASDIHFNIKTTEANSQVKFTVDGSYVVCDKFAHYPTSFMLEMLSLAWMEIKGGNGAVFDPTVEQQGRLERKCNGLRFTLRWASLATDNGPSVCLRLLKSEGMSVGPSLADLGYLPSQVDAFERVSLIEGGAIVLSGTVGSGKSTTIASLMRNIPDNRKVITIEDPVEFIIPNALQNTLTRALNGSDMHVFDAKLATIKRSAMNDLLIGEIRDTAGGRAFMDLAASGANLYTTVHARSCLLICERLSSSLIGVNRDFLASHGVLKLLVHQMLLPALCCSCSYGFHDVKPEECWSCVKGRPRTYTWFAKWAEAIASTYQLDLERLRFRYAPGCKLCHKQNIHELAGIAGRTVIAELIEPAREPEFLDNLNECNRARLRHWHEQRPRSTWTSEDMNGKSIFDCAIYKVSVGELDPRFVEAKFGLINPSLQD